MQTRRQLIIAAGAAATAGSMFAQAAFAQASTAEAQLTKLLDDIFAEALAESPELLTSLGLDKGDRADAKAKLSDASPVARASSPTSSAG